MLRCEQESGATPDRTLTQECCACHAFLQSAISSTADNQRPKVFVSSSAVGYYGASQNSSFTEDSPAGTDYLAEVCQGKFGSLGSTANQPNRSSKVG
jgi:NAD dependent epimerase/dehydratase family enzyme